jgi:hypothetical protein
VNLSEGSTCPPFFAVEDLFFSVEDLQRIAEHAAELSELAEKWNLVRLGSDDRQREVYKTIISKFMRIERLLNPERLPGRPEVPGSVFRPGTRKQQVTDTLGDVIDAFDPLARHVGYGLRTRPWIGPEAWDEGGWHPPAFPAEVIAALKSSGERLRELTAATEGRETLAAAGAAETEDRTSKAVSAAEMGRLLALCGDGRAVQILRIARDKTKSVDERMRFIVDLDKRFDGYKSKRWADLLGVSEGAVRQAPFWIDRKHRKEWGDK